MPSRSVIDQVVVCRQPIVIEVGGIPRQWGRITVKDRKTGQDV